VRGALERDDWLSRAAARLYGAGVAAHAGFWTSGLRRAWTAPVPVISVGNLAVGGTGKTPAVIHLAAALRDRGWRPAVLSRGHGRATSAALVLRPGQAVPSPAEAGDEPIEMFEALRDVPVVVEADRRAAAGRAVHDLGADLLILDDGFQHRPLARTIDLVLLDAARPLGNGRLLPAGPLREPPRALGRADMVLLTRHAPGMDTASATALLDRHAPRAWRGTAAHRTIGVRPLGRPGRKTGPGPPATGPVVAACAIARPETFHAALAEAGFEPAERVSWPDHHRFGAAEVREVTARAAGRPIVTTAKDAVRWRAVPGFDPAGWWVLDIRLEPDAGFLTEIERRLGPPPGA
jgi:tetraacyldisaccharide 4'-kinase